MGIATRRGIGLIVCLVPLGIAAPATAQAAGSWRVTGDVAGRSFVLDCRFDQQGSQVDGTCVDVATGEPSSKPGKRHLLSQGSVHGRTIGWTYPVKVMIMSIDISFAGTFDGNGMTGTVTAKGRQGTFSAKRI